MTLQQEKEEVIQHARAFLVENCNGFLQIRWTAPKNWNSSVHPEIKAARVVLKELELYEVGLWDDEKPLLTLFRALIHGDQPDETREKLLGKMHELFNDTPGPEGTFQEGTLPFSEMLKRAASWCETTADSCTAPENFDSLGGLKPELQKRHIVEAGVWRHRMAPFTNNMLTKRAKERRKKYKAAKTKSEKAKASSRSLGKRRTQVTTAEEDQEEDDQQSRKRPRANSASAAFPSTSATQYSHASGEGYNHVERDMSEEASLPVS
jgi:hypothetical protein